MTSTSYIHLKVIPLLNIVLSLDILVVYTHLTSGKIMCYSAHIIYNNLILKHLLYMKIVLKALEIVIVIIAVVIELEEGS